MTYKYQYRVKISDLWQASMYYAYSSYLAVINIVCIISSIVLIISLWETSPAWFQGFLILFLMLFTVIQPVAVYLRSKSQLAGKYPELTLIFDEKGISITADGEHQDKKWDDVLGIVKKPTILVLYMNDGKGYILRNSVLKDSKKEFYEFALKKISEHRTDHKSSQGS
ncbi:MAG: YcxB family protein [Lachnospiraceae bacterium]|nr:YcxB family protein [Lachnospiraceae bacterium]